MQTPCKLLVQTRSPADLSAGEGHQLLDRVPMLARKPDRHIYGDFNNHFVIFATRGHSSFILSYEELLKSTFYFARILDPEHKIEVYKKMALTNAPDPLCYPSDIVIAFTRNTTLFCRPVPVDLGVNQWADQLYKQHMAVTAGNGAIHHPAIAQLIVALVFNRAPDVVKHAIKHGMTPREYYDKKVLHVNFCLEQNRPVEQFGV